MTASGAGETLGGDTRAKLIEGALTTLRTHGIAGTSARTIATTAGVNQALVFYHFGSVHDLLAAACLQSSQDQVAYYQERFAAVTSLRELLDLSRDLHTNEQATGNLVILAQMLAGAQTDPKIASASAACLDLWVAELENVLTRILTDSPLAEFIDVGGLARGVAASFIGLELYEGVDQQGSARALSALEQLTTIAALLDDAGPLIRRGLRTRMRRT
ncbi:TetR/AcrR family transcriptional regulator [Spirillospora sp. CA-294931]|uniref:TetR/AcrR family transcriptional regulator n=1 Tax=Spirillospora sp. CA-294931 TaxID=3240042 RepID=UPI003D8F2939